MCKATHPKIKINWGGVFFIVISISFIVNVLMMLNFLVLVDAIQHLSANFATTSIRGFKYMDYTHYSDLFCNYSVPVRKQGEAPI